MMIYYFLSLRRKPKINCAKKRRFWVRSIKQKKTWWIYIILTIRLSWYFAESLFRRTRIFSEQIQPCRILLYYKLLFFSYLFFLFFKYAQKNSPMHETSRIVVVTVVLKWKAFDFKLTNTTTIKQRY